MNPLHDCSQDGGHLCSRCLDEVLVSLRTPNMKAVKLNTVGFGKEVLYVSILFKAFGLVVEADFYRNTHVVKSTSSIRWEIVRVGFVTGVAFLI